MAEPTRDGLSSLPDDILIEIISRLPFHSAIDTALLSRRWRGLCTNLTSLNISTCDFSNLEKFFTSFNEIMKHIMSPCIYTFTAEISRLITIYNWQDSWLRQICDRNVHFLKLTWFSSRNQDVLKIPSFIFQTQSLVSLELSSTFHWQFPDDSDPICLPNLKNLRLSDSHSYDWLEKLIKSLPSLENLSLHFRPINSSGLYIKCSNQNLRQLSMNLGINRRSKVAINAPKLEYLDVAAPQSATFSFEVKPVMLREAKIDVTYKDLALSDEENRLIMSIFYDGLFNARFLVLDAFVLGNVSTVFSRAISLTLCMKKMPQNNMTLFSILDLCPKLENLTLKFPNIREQNEECGIFEEPGLVNPLQQVVRQIDIEIYWYMYDKPAKAFLLILHCLLSNSTVLKRFNVRLIGSDLARVSVEYKRTIELNYCKQLYEHRIVSTECEVKFIGRYVEMSYNTGSKVGKEIGEVITFK